MVDDAVLDAVAGMRVGSSPTPPYQIIAEGNLHRCVGTPAKRFVPSGILFDSGAFCQRKSKPKDSGYWQRS